MKKKIMTVTMKKKIIMAIAAGVVLVAAAGGRDTFAASAQTVRSRGNIRLDDGRMAVYSSDIHYLQAELEDLFKELPTHVEEEKEEEAHDENN